MKRLNRIHGNTKHGYTQNGVNQPPLYQVWSQMKARCCNPRHKSYHRYGGRGIKVCERWLHSFVNFYEDMGDRPTDSHSLDRIDNNGNYEPDNCRWATSAEQQRNMRSNVLITLGDKTYVFADALKKFGREKHRCMIEHRLKDLHWSPEKAFHTPPRRGGWR